MPATPPLTYVRPSLYSTHKGLAKASFRHLRSPKKAVTRVYAPAGGGGGGGRVAGSTAAGHGPGRAWFALRKIEAAAVQSQTYVALRIRAAINVKDRQAMNMHSLLQRLENCSCRPVQPVHVLA